MLGLSWDSVPQNWPQACLCAPRGDLALPIPWLGSPPGFCSAKTELRSSCIQDEQSIPWAMSPFRSLWIRHRIPPNLPNKSKLRISFSLIINYKVFICLFTFILSRSSACWTLHAFKRKPWARPSHRTSREVQPLGAKPWKSTLIFFFDCVKFLKFLTSFRQ